MGVKLLAIDASTSVLALALGDAERPFKDASRIHLPGGAAASALLVPQILALLAQREWQLADLDAIGFARGPGAFTGLRTACSVAQGLAFGANKPVLALDSLLLVAEDARLQGLAVAATAAMPEVADWAVAMDARMDEIYAASYRHESGRWLCTSAPALYDLEAWQAHWRRLHAQAAPAGLAGTALAAFGDRLAPHTPGGLRIATEHDRAGALWRLAVAAWQQGEAKDAAQALPLYLRDKIASTTQERFAERAMRAARPAAPPAMPTVIAPAAVP